jgi:cystathionine beta-lyase/cystathionine gamma-synthase
MVKKPTSGQGFGTRAIRVASTPPDVRQMANSVPIYQAATFAAEDSAELGDILADRKPGFAYARIDNPTAAAMATAIAELEGAEAAYSFASGMAAIHGALFALTRAGDRIVSTRAVYGSTRQLMTKVLARFGVETVFVDPTDLEAVEAALPGARILYLETISNPTIIVADLAELAARAHRHGVTVVVDNTFASPFLCRPLELGADLVIESCTKWIGGHSDVVAGSVAGSHALVMQVRALEVEAGGIAAPFTAFLVLRGIETLHVRMERHCANALAVARFLEASPEVVSVMYPGLASHPQAGVAQRQLRAGGGMLALDLGDRAVAAAFLDALTIPPRTASLGSIQTIAVHPPSSTHRQLTDAELADSGIPQGLVRVSVGLEDIEDLLADMAVGLAAARAVKPASHAQPTMSTATH